MEDITFTKSMISELSSRIERIKDHQTKLEQKSKKQSLEIEKLKESLEVTNNKLYGLQLDRYNSDEILELIKIHLNAMEKLIDKLEKKECIICMQRDPDTLFLPCRHLCCCEMCNSSLKICPLCNTKIEKVIKVYRT